MAEEEIKRLAEIYASEAQEKSGATVPQDLIGQYDIAYDEAILVLSWANANGYLIQSIPKKIVKGSCPHLVNGNCPFHNLQCQWPQCEYEK